MELAREAGDMIRSHAIEYSSLCRSSGAEGSILTIYPQLALWATDIASASRTHLTKIWTALPAINRLLFSSLARAASTELVLYRFGHSVLRAAP
jgi:hypothetical protein